MLRLIARRRPLHFLKVLGRDLEIFLQKLCSSSSRKRTLARLISVHQHKVPKLIIQFDNSVPPALEPSMRRCHAKGSMAIVVELMEIDAPGPASHFLADGRFNLGLVAYLDKALHGSY
ncbi:hypothetical protein VNO77_19617 [Canavalia gladiata]|uniref:Uncharacterized protein n=1 Tax=Canavalia gladiata TaxID=3824 RepID=A0AAN9LMY6_CANGL